MSTLTEYNKGVVPTCETGERTRMYWVIAEKKDKPSPAMVEFQGGNAVKVFVTGKLHVIFPYAIYAWGPICRPPEYVGPPEPDPVYSLEKVHPVKGDELTEHQLDEGVECPTCNQYIKRYKRRFNSGMASTLCWLVEAHRKIGMWIDVNATAPRYVLQSNEISRLVHWGMVVQKENKDTRKRTSGLWMPTEQATLFIKGEISVPSHVFLLNNKVTGWSESHLYLKDIKGNRFDYTELMKSL